MVQSRLAASVEEYVRKAVADCADDEIALDALAQWASNQVGKEGGYAIEESYPTIRENLCGRFNISDAIASEYVERLREYGTEFFISGADIRFVRERILTHLSTEAGSVWRKGALKRLSKSPPEIKRVAALIRFLIHEGFDIGRFETSLEQLQAFHVAAFERAFSALEIQESLEEIGLLNRVLYSVDGSTKHHTYTLNSLLLSQPLGLNPEDLKVQTDSKQFVFHLSDKKMFDQLCLLDEVSAEDFGIMRFEAGPENFQGEKRIWGHYDNYVAISPFLLAQIREDIHAVKQLRMEEYESRIDNTLSKIIVDQWPGCKMDSIAMAGDQALWRLGTGADAKLFVYLTSWATEADAKQLLSKLEDPNSSTIIAVILNQSPELAKIKLKEIVDGCAEVSLVYQISQKEARAETLKGTPDAHSSKLVDVLSKSLNLSNSLSKLLKQDSDQVENSNTEQSGASEESLKIILGEAEKKDVYWAPSSERNWNLGIFGDSGTDSTDAIKRILIELRKANAPFLVVHAKGEYVPKDPLGAEFQMVVSLDEIAINPLELDEGNSPRMQRYRILENLMTTYGLEEVEVSILDRAIKSSYAKNGFLEDNKSTWTKTAPTLQDVLSSLENSAQAEKGREKDSINKMLQRIRPLLEHPVFSKPQTSLPFEKVVIGPVFLSLAEIREPCLQEAMVDFFIQKIPTFTFEDSEDLKLFLVLDGFDKLFGRGSCSLRLLRSGKQRGVSVIYSNQSPANLPDLAYNSTGTMLSFGISDSKNGKALAENIGVKDQVLSKGLSEKFKAVVKFSSEPSPVLFKALPDFRNQPGTSEDSGNGE